MKFAKVVVTLFDANGHVLNVDFTYTNPDHIPAHATRGYAVAFSGHCAGTHSIRTRSRPTTPERGRDAPLRAIHHLRFAIRSVRQCLFPALLR